MWQKETGQYFFVKIFLVVYICLSFTFDVFLPYVFYLFHFLCEFQVK